jgi:hypothetical protein
VLQDGDPKEPISHGICSACAKDFLKEFEKVKEHNDRIDNKGVKK